MKKLSVLCLLLIIGASVVIVGQKRSSSRTKPGSKPKTTSQTKDEAYALALKSWDQYFVTCGDSHYSKLTSGQICEYSPFSIDYEDLTISEADKLNGVEREVVSHVKTKAERCYKNGAWPPWYPFGPGFSLRLIKKAGKWSGPFNSGGFSIGLFERANFACSDIPQ